MPAELKIRWDGDVPGLAEHRLSLDAFGEPLSLLLAALRRIATQMVSSAVEPKIGRFANVARWIDIELVKISEGSSGPDALVVFHNPPDELPLWADIPTRATVEMLEALELESKGQVRNSAVRPYLRALPKTVRRQVYEYTNGAAHKRVEIGDIALTDLPLELPTLRKMEGNIIGVGFEPGRTEVRIRTETTQPPMAATPQAVEQALELRHDNVRTISVHAGTRARLVALRRSIDPDFKFDSQAATKHIFDRWDNVLRQLAK